MAAETLTTLQNTLTLAAAQRFEDIFIRRVSMDESVESIFDYMRAIGAVDIGQYDVTMAGGGGDKMARVIVKSSTGNTVTPFNSGDPRPAGGTRTDSKAEWNWKNYWTTIHMTGEAYRAAVAGVRWNQADAWAEKLNDAFMDIKDQIDADMADATAANRIDSILAAIGTENNTYAGIDRAVVTNWNPYRNDAAAAAVSKALMDNVDQALREVRRVNYDHILCSVTQQHKLGDILDARRRNVNDILPGDLLYNNRRIIPLAGLQNDQIYFVDSSKFKVRFQEYRENAMVNGQQMPVTQDGLPYGVFVNDDGSDGISTTISVSVNQAMVNTFRAGFIDNLAV